MVDVKPVFSNNEQNSEERPAYVVSRLVGGVVVPEGRTVKDELPPEDNPTYIAYKAPEVQGSASGGESTSNDNAPSERADSIPVEPTTSESISKP